MGTRCIRKKGGRREDARGRYKLDDRMLARASLREVEPAETPLTSITTSEEGVPASTTDKGGAR